MYLYVDQHKFKHTVDLYEDKIVYNVRHPPTFSQKGKAASSIASMQSDKIFEQQDKDYALRKD